MPQYVLVLDAHAMDHIPDEDMADVDEAAHAVSQEAIDAGVWVCGSGLDAQRASIVSADGTVTDGPPVRGGGLTVIEVPSRDEAQKWAAKWAAACRCDQEIWELGLDPKSMRCSVRQTTDSCVSTSDLASRLGSGLVLAAAGRRALLGVSV